MKTAYFILGMHRSGTSALGGVLNIMGLEFGSDLMPANEGNSKGYFENNFVYRLNETILRENNSSWDDYNFSISKIDKQNITRYIKEAKEIIKSEFKYAENFVIKDPRNCLLFPIWEKACMELGIKTKIILPYRNPLEVASSLKKRNDFSSEKSLILWLHHFLSAEFLSREHDRMFSSFDDLLDKPKSTLKTLTNFTNLETDKKTLKQINKFLDKNVKHNNISMKNFTKEAPQFLQKTIKLIKNANFNNLNNLNRIRRDFYYSLDLFQKDIKGQLLCEKNNIKNLNLTIQSLNKTIQEQKEQHNKLTESSNKTINEKSSQIQSLNKTIEEQKEQHNKLTESSNKTINEKSSQIQSLSKTIQEQKEQHNKLTESSNKTINEKSSQIQSLNKDLQEQKNEYNKLAESSSKTIEEQKEQHNKLTESSNKTINEKSSQIESLNKDLQEQKNIYSKQNDLLQSKNIKIKEIEGQVLTLKQQTKKLNLKNKSLVKENKQLISKLQNKEQLISKLQEEKMKLLVQQKTRIQEIAELNTQIDSIIEDLSSIKESKCWIYTKPIRDLQKVFKD